VLHPQLLLGVMHLMTEKNVSGFPFRLAKSLPLWSDLDLGKKKLVDSAAIVSCSIVLNDSSKLSNSIAEVTSEKVQ